VPPPPKEARLPDLFGAEPPPEEAPPPDGPGLFGEAAPAPEPPPKVAAYRVLARKYRPAGFDALIGQDGMKRVLTRSFEQNRIAHAWVLTGVRGVGKTTTARILARALNCLGADGTQDRPTITPCGVCANCRAIAEDRHPDIIELDAATHTGVDNVRELNTMVQYRPASARYRLIIYDEAHMLSAPSWNALLKTLEEPPAHTKFVFATTEIRKVPVTVLSRCQRFDLRRIPEEMLATHYASIARAEGIAVEDSALAMLARAADGSVRDGLSLLDQAISAAEDGAPVTAEAVRTMLGLADRIAVFDLFEDLMGGRIADALRRFAHAHELGAQPKSIIEDLLALTHWVTLCRITPAEAEKPGIPEAERTRGRTLATALPIPALGRAWQMLLKGLAEVREASDAKAAAEMVLIRLAHSADLPSPAELVRRLSGASPPGPSAPPSPGGGTRAVANGGTVAMTQPMPAPGPAITSLRDVVALARGQRDALLASQVAGFVHLVRLDPPLLEFRAADGAPRDLSARMRALLTEATFTQWTVAISTAPGARTLADQDGESATRHRAGILAHPMVAAILAAFPGATVETAPPPIATAPQPDVDLPPHPANDADDPFGDALVPDELPDELPDDLDA
jgi:DNA polymerase-3 subunit gamma/tau